jgi:hypothetical protein
MTDRYASALEALQAAESRPETFAQPFVDVLPVSGAAVSTLGAFLGSETISATDALAARLDELQFDLSEGPCWQAIARKRPVLEPALVSPTNRDWPTFASAAAGEGVRSMFAFPLIVGALPVGAVDLYSIPEVSLTNEQCRQAIAMSEIVGRHVLRKAIREGEVAGEDAEPGGFSRRVVHQATGVVIAQLQVSPDDARLIIQGHAFAAGRPMKEIAREILSGAVSFAHGENGIESSGGAG